MTGQESGCDSCLRKVCSGSGCVFSAAESLISPACTVTVQDIEAFCLVDKLCHCPCDQNEKKKKKTPLPLAVWMRQLFLTIRKAGSDFTTSWESELGMFCLCTCWLRSCCSVLYHNMIWNKELNKTEECFLFIFLKKQLCKLYYMKGYDKG